MNCTICEGECIVAMFSAWLRRLVVARPISLDSLTNTQSLRNEPWGIRNPGPLEASIDLRARYIRLGKCELSAPVSLRHIFETHPVSNCNVGTFGCFPASVKWHRIEKTSYNYHCLIDGVIDNGDRVALSTAMISWLSFVLLN